MAKADKKNDPEIEDNPQITAREKALKKALADIEKAYGKGAVMKFGEKADLSGLEVIPSGILSLDVALGIGGIPRGRIIEIYGPESSGKTTVTLHIIAEVQKRGGVAAFIDAEHALDPNYARKLGVNIDELYISQPDNGEQALEIAEAMVRSAAIDFVVIDSVAALVPKAEIDGAMGAPHMGLHARLMSQALRKMTGFVNRYNCSVMFTNQLRANIGTMGYGGPQETTTGGRALKFYASIRLDIKRLKSINPSASATDVIIGYQTRIKVAKNKLAPPFKSVEVDLIFGEGVSRPADLLDLALALGKAQKSGSWFSYGDLRLGQGRENAKAFLRQNPDLMTEIEDAVLENYGFKRVGMLSHVDTKPSDDENKSKKKSSKKTEKKEEEQELSFDEELFSELQDMSEEIYDE